MDTGKTWPTYHVKHVQSVLLLMETEQLIVEEHA